MADETLHIPELRLTAIIRHLFEAVEVVPDHAARAARILTTADLRGVASHGARLVLPNVSRILGGAIRAKPDIRPIARTGPVETWDGDSGMGMVCGSLAMDRAIALADTHGIGCVTVRKSNHLGACAAFVMMAVERGMIGITISNSSPMVAIEGAVSRVIGNNPLAIGAPSPEFPLVLDMAMSIASGGRVAMMRRRGGAIPNEWFVSAGESDHRLAFRPFGAAKGSGLAIMMEVLTGVLAGGAILSDLSVGAGFSETLPDKCCHTLIAVNVEAVLAKGHYDAAMIRLVEELKQAPPAPGVKEVLLPGERAWRATLKHRREGIPLEADTVRALEDMAAELGTSIEWE